MQAVEAVESRANSYRCGVSCKLLYLRNIINTIRAVENLANCYSCGECSKLFHLRKILQTLTALVSYAAVTAEKNSSDYYG